MRFAHDTLNGGLNIVAPRRADRLKIPKLPGCPFCPGAEAGTPPELDRVVLTDGISWGVRAIPNLFPLADRHEVHILCDRHITSTRSLNIEEWTRVVDMWQRRLDIPVRDHSIAHLFINDGRAAGASIDHLHSQLVEVPNTPRAAATYKRTRGRSCAACSLVVGHPELVVWERNGLVVRASDAPSASGELLLLPTDHVTHLDAHEPKVLAEAIHALCQAGTDSDRNIWFSIAPDQGSHWFATLLPRVATLAGVELGLGIGVSLVEPADAAEQARKRLSQSPVNT